MSRLELLQGIRHLSPTLGIMACHWPFNFIIEVTRIFPHRIHMKSLKTHEASIALGFLIQTP